MPVDLRVHAAQPKIAHWVMNSGYKIRNGGLGKVNAIVTAHPMLRNQARISSTQRMGLESQSAFIHCFILFIFYPAVNFNNCHEHNQAQKSNTNC